MIVEKLKSDIQYLIEDYQKRVEDIEEDLRVEHVSPYLTGKVGVYAKVIADLQALLEEEE